MDQRLLDENSEIIDRIARSGADLTQPRDVDFQFLAADKAVAYSFATAVRRLGISCRVYPPDTESIEEGDTQWTAECRSHMIPTATSITATEIQLTSIAATHSCTPDGWGFFE